MKIVVVTQDAPLYLPQFLDDFFALLKIEEHVVSEVVVLSPTFKKSAYEEMVQRYHFYGLWSFLRMLALIIYHKVLSKLYGTLPWVDCHSVGNVIRKHALSISESKDINDASFIESIQKQDIDIVVSIAAPQIFRQPLLDVPRLGCLNYHTALLPRYRGRQPLFWALYHDEPHVGITIHEIDKGVDSGPIVEQIVVEVESNDSLHSLYLKTISLGPELLCRAIDRIASGDTLRKENNPAEATTFSFPSATEARSFRKSGKRFF